MAPGTLTFSAVFTPVFHARLRHLDMTPTTACLSFARHYVPVSERSRKRYLTGDGVDRRSLATPTGFRCPRWFATLSARHNLDLRVRLKQKAKEWKIVGF